MFVLLSVRDSWSPDSAASVFRQLCLMAVEPSEEALGLLILPAPDTGCAVCGKALPQAVHLGQTYQIPVG